MCVVMPSIVTHGIDRIYTPDDGRGLGLQGMINDVLAGCDFEVGQPTEAPGLLEGVKQRQPAAIARAISLVENYPEATEELRAGIAQLAGKRQVPVLGITGTGGAGKSSLVDELVRRYLADFSDKTLAIVSVDPSNEICVLSCAATILTTFLSFLLSKLSRGNSV